MILFYFIAVELIPSWVINFALYGISSNLSLKTHHVIHTSYKPLESVIYIGNDYAT